MEKLKNLALKDLDPIAKKLVEECVKAREFAYCPYSKFKVGAAVECESGNIYTGCNIENASFGISICAERTAIVKAISIGDMNLKVIAVCGEINGQPVAPCGSCRQFIVEFRKNKDIIIYLTNEKMNKIIKTTISDLLPLAFTDF